MEPRLMSPRECSSGKEGEETQAWPPTGSLPSEWTDSPRKLPV